MPIITLTTDFGLADSFVGVMKGVILSIAPGVQIVDLTHQVPPQDILQGALVLESAVGYFTAGTIHLAVVDPGVGSERRAIAVETDRSILIGPDNGLLSLAAQRMAVQRIYSIENPAYWLPRVSATFHGRDVFAPAAAHLAGGVAIEALGPPLAEMSKLEISRPLVTGERIESEVLAIDRFGNLITAITATDLAEWAGDPAHVLVEGRYAGRIQRTYCDVDVGESVAYLGSGDRLEIGIRNANAALEFPAERGTRIEVVRE